MEKVLEERTKSGQTRDSKLLFNFEDTKHKSKIYVLKNCFDELIHRFCEAKPQFFRLDENLRFVKVTSKQKKHKTEPEFLYKWGCSSAGRAPALHAGGQEFDPPHLHHGTKDEHR